MKEAQSKMPAHQFAFDKKILGISKPKEKISATLDIEKKKAFKISDGLCEGGEQRCNSALYQHLEIKRYAKEVYSLLYKRAFLGRKETLSL
ncbi:hypothetical protein [Candidatus Liberibacter sp.]|uniref:hypothetical protein n=1 Tax=Candidatus Liberibacter sp. TaxID=34022 RepID=UPI0015F56BEE|nr:hypothetical protein [Candidatus Liberibacter sp.]MBA5724087.1 hypothetical protein [Candidatus Liberibacter sp.]